MAEILKEWLSERLNLPITWKPEEFVTLMRDGNVLAQLLFSYKAINDEQRFLIRPATTEEDIRSNWAHLIAWLKNMDIPFGESELKRVLDQRGSTLLRLFYQLFLYLDKKDRTNFIKRERKLVSNLISKMGGRFNVEKVDDEEIQTIDYLAKPLVDEKYFIEWQKSKSEQLKQTYDLMRSQFQKTCERIEVESVAVKRERVEKPFKMTKEKYAIDKFEKKHPCKYEDYTYQELLDMDEKVKEEGSTNVLDEMWAKDYLSQLQSKFTNVKETKEFQRKLSNAIASSVWEQTLGEDEEHIGKELAEKVMKLSHFEKQMCTHLMETKQQARNLTKNRIDAEKEFGNQRKRQFEQYLDDLRNQIQSELVEIDFEKQRQDELHKKLYAEKIKRKRQHYYEICYDTMLSIVDYAVKYAYTKMLIGCDIPSHFIHEWKALYFKQQPIFDTLEIVEEVLTVNNAGESTIVEAVVYSELDRQRFQNVNDFLEYQNMSGPWEIDTLIPNYDPNSTERLEEYLGLRVLGHVVYKLLETKYPLPPVRLPADLPNYKSKAILRCLPDRSITVPMQALLNAKKIAVVRVESSINYCLKCFKTEMIGCTDINLSFDKFIASATESDKDLIKLLKIEGENTQSEHVIQTGITAINVKQTQTPKTIPEEDMLLSPSAELGKYAYELLCGGEPLTDHLISAIVVEYLKTLKDINGFVLINYPNLYYEAQILEETLLGRAPPDVNYLEREDDAYLEKCMAKKSAQIKDIYEDVRRSQLVPDPHNKKEVVPFVSYFTAYIHLKESLNILAEQFIWDLTPENSDIIDRYYASQYVNYSIYYEVVDKDVLALICKYIIGDFELPSKDPDTLFGTGVLSALEFPSSEDKRQKSKVLKPESSKTNALSSKLKRTSKSSKTVIVSKENKPLNVPMEEEAKIIVEEETLEEINEMAIAEEETEEIVKPGDENWQYGDLPLDESFTIALSTVWEEAERAYISDIENLFFAKRLQMNNVIPYSKFVKDKVEQIITRPSEKQELVSDFQHQYNDYEDDWRFTNLTRIEWHCRVKELQRSLYNICDLRKKDSLSERQRLIYENWTMEELTAMANTYISCMQSELNRATLTYQLLHDFYYTMLKRPLTTERLVSKDLNKIVRESDESPRSKRSADEKLYSKLKLSFQEMHMKNIALHESNNPYNFVLENNMKTAMKIVKELNVKYQAIIAKEYGEASKISASKPKKAEADIGGTDQLDEELVKMHSLKCLDEWRTAIDGEMHRINRRLEMLLGKAYVDLKLFNDCMTRTFMKLEEEINEYYTREIESVDRLCEYIQLAIEKSERIRPTLILEQDEFIVDPNLELFTSPTTSLASEVGERPAHGEFRMDQLARLRDNFKLIAPDGIILEPKFIYLLQDFLLYGKESCSGPLVPAAWSSLEPEQIPEIVLEVFGETAYVDWRDFLVYCLGVRYPNVTELLEMRKELRCQDKEGNESIARDDFMNIPLWFEAEMDTDDPIVQLRIGLMKTFIFELFETAQDVMSIPALLLALCKDPDPRLGFSAAVSMAVGERVCCDAEECEEVILKLIELKEYKDACRACALDCADNFTSALLDEVIQFCEGTTITEVLMTPSSLEFHLDPKKKEKQKQKPAKGKPKKEKSLTMTPRIPKQKSLQNASAIESKRDMMASEMESQRELEGEQDDRTAETGGETARTQEFDPPYEAPPGIIYSVSPKVITDILEICLPWHFKTTSVDKQTPYAKQIAEVLEKLGSDTGNGDVYVAKFLNEKVVCKILKRVKKFHSVKLLDIAANIIEQKP